MNLESAIVGLLLLASAGFVLRSAWHMWTASGSRGCGAGCGGCAAGASKTLVPLELVPLDLNARTVRDSTPVRSSH